MKRTKAASRWFGGSKAPSGIADVWVVLHLPDELRPLVKQLSLSVRLAEPVDEIGTGAAPGLHKFRLVGRGEIFSIRIRLPSDTPFHLHAMVVIEDANPSPNTNYHRRWVGFQNASFRGLLDERDIVIHSHRFSHHIIFNPRFRLSPSVEPEKVLAVQAL